MGVASLPTSVKPVLGFAVAFLLAGIALMLVFKFGLQGVSEPRSGLESCSVDVGFEADAKARVLRVVDGDTIWVEILEVYRASIGLLEEGEYRVRLADINAPELGEEGGLDAKRVLEHVLSGRRYVLLDVDDCFVTDRYGRLIAVVLAPENSYYLNVNAWMVDRGFASYWDHENEFIPERWEVVVPLGDVNPLGRE